MFFGNVYGRLSVAIAILLGGVTWWVFWPREETILAIVLVVSTALMPYAAWINNSSLESPLVRRGKYIVMILVLLWALWFAGFAFNVYQ